MMYVLWFVGGMMVGIIVAVIIHSLRTTVGTLRIDRTNPEKDVYRFDVDNLDKLSKQKRIILKVDNKAIISQK